MFILRVKHFNTYPQQHPSIGQSRKVDLLEEKKFYLIVLPLPNTDRTVKTFTFVEKPWPWIIRRETCPPSNNQPCLMHAIKVEVWPLALQLHITQK